MKRNTALTWLAFGIVLFAPMFMPGPYEGSFTEAVNLEVEELTKTNPGGALAVCFLVLAGYVVLASVLTRIFIAIWGETTPRPPQSDAAIADRYYSQSRKNGDRP